MPSLCMIMSVYNEAEMLKYLEPTLRHVDEAVIIEGGPIGLSTDNTAEIIREYQSRYPIRFIQDTFRREDGGFDHASMKNMFFDHVKSDFIILQHADLLFRDESCLTAIREAIDRFPEKMVFYWPALEFYRDMDHVLLHGFTKEPKFPRPSCLDALVFNMKMEPYFSNHPTVGMHYKVDWTSFDALLLPDVLSYHMAFVKPFPDQVEKHVRRITQRDWGSGGEQLLLAGYEAVFEAAVKAVETYDKQPSYDFFGRYPDVLGGKKYSVMDGRQEFYENIMAYRNRFAAYYEKEYYQGSYKPWLEG